MITETFIQTVADFTNQKITKVVLNETYEITHFEVKYAEDGRVVLNYIVPYEGVETITSIALKNEADEVVSTNEVNVPITADTLMIQTITIEEVI